MLKITRQDLYGIFLSLIVGSILLGILFSIQFFDVSPEDEWPNNITLIVEVVVGIVITLIVLMITKINEVKIEEKITNVLNIVKEREKIQKEKEKQVFYSILSALEDIQSVTTKILSRGHDYEQLEDLADRRPIKEQILLECSHLVEISSKNLDDKNRVSLEFFNYDTMGLIKTISSLCKNKPRFNDDNKTVDVSFCNNIRNMVEPRIAELSNILKSVEIISKSPVKLESHINKISLSVSSDRTVYPLDSVIHVRANLSSVVPKQKILFEVFNVNRKLLLSQNLDTDNNGIPELSGSNIFQACFKMEGDGWKVGGMYIVRATHDSSFAEDSFVIEQRTPVIQTDKSVYIAGSDMILTVIDPDADKDNQLAEFVGDREDSKVILESKYGKIDGYKLRETGDSTGIFQGIIGVLNIRKNGKVIPQTVDGKIIDKIQGTGITDGFIGGSRGDEITISYKNNSGIVYLTVFVSNFGAVVEMDQKTYGPNDKVYITIVAPDLNLNSDKIDEIGRNPESLVQIRTSVDQLESYSLIETGLNTGIFTGKLQLTPIKNNVPKQFSRPQGPNDGILYCDTDDFIEIVFSFFGDEEIVGRAQIVH